MRDKVFFGTLGRRQGTPAWATGQTSMDRETGQV